MQKVVTATEARIRFGELIRQVVENREPVLVERGGKPQVIVLSVDEYERLVERQQQNQWRNLVDGAREQIRSELDTRNLIPPEKILVEIREARDAHCTHLR